MATSNVFNWSSILVLVLFLLTNLLVIFPIRAKIPHIVVSYVNTILITCRILIGSYPPRRQHKFIFLDFRTVPLVSVLTLLAVGAIDGTVVRDGILGVNGVKPINIMALFMSLAYISISLDATGLFRFLAFWVVRRGGSSGQKLYFYLYAFFLFFGVVVGNDPVILSGTAFLAYLTRVSGITPPTAWIYAQFAAANMASCVLVSSNPTNLVLSGAFSLSFTTYTAHLILPFLSAAILVYPVLVLVLFRSPVLIPPSIELHLEHNDAAPLATLVDRSGAIFGSVLLVVTLGVLVGTSTVGVPVWEVTVPPAVIMLVRDTCHDWNHRKMRRGNQRAPQAESLEVNITPATDALELEAGHDSPTVVISSYSDRHRTESTFQSLLTESISRFSSLFPTVLTILSRLPLALLPFAFLMFILVQGLASQGWVEVFASWWTVWASKTGVLGVVGGMGFITCVFCNICGTNIGATILLAQILQHWIADSQPSARMRDGAIYALAIGSNYGAFTQCFSASLAGLLWKDILRQKGIIVRQRQFLTLNLPLVFTAMLASSAVLVGQVYVVNRE